MNTLRIKKIDSTNTYKVEIGGEFVGTVLHFGDVWEYRMVKNPLASGLARTRKEAIDYITRHAND